MHVLSPLTFFKSQTLMLHHFSMVMIHYMSFYHSTILLLHHFVILSFLCFVVSLLHHAYHALLLHHFVIVLMVYHLLLFIHIVGLLFAPYLVKLLFYTSSKKGHIFKKQLLFCSRHGTTIFKL
jgi:hypothetical protein